MKPAVLLVASIVAAGFGTAALGGEAGVPVGVDGVKGLPPSIKSLPSDRPPAPAFDGQDVFSRETIFDDKKAANEKKGR